MNVSFKRVAMVTVCMLICCTGPAISQEKKVAAQSNEGTTITRVYDIQSLLKPIQDYPIGWSTSGGPGVAFGADPVMGDMGMGEMGVGGFEGTPGKVAAKPQSRAEQILALLMETIDAESWRENGGADGALRLIGNSLVVTQTPQNQNQVSELLGQLRKQSQRPVRVQAWWIWIDSDTDDFIKRPAETKSGVEQSAVLPEVDLEGLTNALDAVRYKGEIVCFNGQTVQISAGRGRSIVTGVNPVVGASSVGYDPDIEYVRSGAMLQVTPTIEDSGEVLLDLRSEVTELDQNSDTPLIDMAPLTPTTQGTVTGGGVTQVDRLAAVSQSFATTVRLPVGRPLLVGGMTFSADDETDGQLYLVVELSTGE